MGASTRGATITPNRASYSEAGVVDTARWGVILWYSPYDVLDMAGNVAEWCLTKWRDDYILPPDDDPAGEDRRVMRGGSYWDADWSVRCAYRSGTPLTAVTTTSVFGSCVCLRPIMPLDSKSSGLSTPLRSGTSWHSESLQPEYSANKG